MVGVNMQKCVTSCEGNRSDLDRQKVGFNMQMVGSVMQKVCHYMQEYRLLTEETIVCKSICYVLILSCCDTPFIMLSPTMITPAA